MRTYWLVDKLQDDLYSDNIGIPCDGKVILGLTSLNCEPDSKRNLIVGSDMKKHNIPYNLSMKQNHSAEEMKDFSSSEINGYNSYEISVKVRDDSPLGHTVQVTPPPAPDLLPKVRFETKM